MTVHTTIRVLTVSGIATSSSIRCVSPLSPPRIRLTTVHLRWSSVLLTVSGSVDGTSRVHVHIRDRVRWSDRLSCIIERRLVGSVSIGSVVLCSRCWGTPHCCCILWSGSGSRRSRLIVPPDTTTRRYRNCRIFGQVDRSLLQGSGNLRLKPLRYLSGRTEGWGIRNTVEGSRLPTAVRGLNGRRCLMTNV